MEKKAVSTCVVCGETSDQVTLHYSRLLCNGCRAFFKRTVQGKVKLARCKLRGECMVTVESRKHCKPCRYAACVRAGVDVTKVQPQRESVTDSPERKEAKYLYSARSGFQNPPTPHPSLYPHNLYTHIMPSDLTYYRHRPPATFDHHMMVPPPQVLPFPGHLAPQTPSQSLALFSSNTDAFAQGVQHNAMDVSHNLNTNLNKQMLPAGLPRNPAPIGQFPTNTAYYHGQSAHCDPPDVNQFSVFAFTSHQTNDYPFNHSVQSAFTPPVYIGGQGNHHTPGPLSHSIDRFLPPFMSSLTSALQNPNPQYKANETKIDTSEQHSKESQTSEKSTAFMISSLLETESESKSIETAAEKSVNSSVAMRGPMGRVHRDFVRFDIPANSEENSEKSSNRTHGDSSLRGQSGQMTSTPNAKDNQPPKSVEIEECNTPSPINTEEEEDHLDSGVGGKLHVTNDEPIGIKNSETPLKSDSGADTSHPVRLSKSNYHSGQNTSIKKLPQGSNVEKEFNDNHRMGVADRSRLIENDSGIGNKTIDSDFNNSYHQSSVNSSKIVEPLSKGHDSLNKTGQEIGLFKSTHNETSNDSADSPKSLETFASAWTNGLVSVDRNLDCSAEILGDNCGGRNAQVEDVSSSTCVQSLAKNLPRSVQSETQNSEQCVNDENELSSNYISPKKTRKVQENKNLSNASTTSPEKAPDVKRPPRTGTPNRKRCLIELQRNNATEVDKRPLELDTNNSYNKESKPQIQQGHDNYKYGVESLVDTAQVHEMVKVENLTFEESAAKSGDRDRISLVEEKKPDNVVSINSNNGSILDSIIVKIRCAKNEKEVADAKTQLEQFYNR